MQNKIKSDFGFADSIFVSYERIGTEFKVLIDIWNDKRLAISFFEFEGALDSGAGDISDFVEETEETGFFRQVISHVYSKVPSEHSYRLYQFLDVDGTPSLEVVASDVKITSIL